MGSLLKGDEMSRWKNGADSETGQQFSNLFDFEF